MPLPPTEVEELGTQPLVGTSSGHYPPLLACGTSRSLRWEWVVVEALPTQCHYHQQRYPIDYPSWVPNLCWYQFRSLSTSVGMRYAVDL